MSDTRFAQHTVMLLLIEAQKAAQVREQKCSVDLKIADGMLGLLFEAGTELHQFARHIFAKGFVQPF